MPPKDSPRRIEVTLSPDALAEIETLAQRLVLGHRNKFAEILRAVDALERERSDNQVVLFREPRVSDWPKYAATLVKQEPLTLKRPPVLDLNGVATLVEQIIGQFQFLIEHRRLSEILYHDGKPRPEKAAQSLFFAVAYAYCKANNLDLTPEADTGNGPVDFKVAVGFAERVLIEIKLSTNKKLVKGYTHQLETYKVAEETLKGFYVVIDVGRMGKKNESLIKTMNEAAERGESVSRIVFINGARKSSASKL